MALLSGSKHRDTCPSCQSELQSQIGEGESLDFCRKCRFPLMLVANKYRLVNKLTEGGFAILYGAEHIHLERDARRVIKVIKPEYLSNESMRARFVREVQVTSALSQRNNHIVRIYDDFGEIANLGYFYIMEYLEGQPLNEMLDDVDGLLPLNLCYHLFLQLCDAMREAHKTSIVHRDLKPHNIFIVEQGRDKNFLKVIDFGIAKPIGNQPDQAQVTQGILGTPAYMSPEQCVNKNVSARSDIYSMGVILYELLVGETPFVPRDPKKQEDLSVMEIMSAHLNTPPPPLQSKQPPNRNIPWALEEIVQCALAKRPEDRYNSVEEMEQAFYNVLPELRPTGAYRTGLLVSEAHPGDTVREIPIINEAILASIQNQTPRSAFENSLFASQESDDAFPSAYELDEGATEVAIQTVSSLVDQEPFRRDQSDFNMGAMRSDFDSIPTPPPPSAQDFHRKVIEIDRRQEPQRNIPLATPIPMSSSLLAPDSSPSRPTLPVDKTSSPSLPPLVERGASPALQRASDSYLPASAVPSQPPVSSPSIPGFHAPNGTTPARRPRQARSTIQSALLEPTGTYDKILLVWLSVIAVLLALLLFLTRTTWQPWLGITPKSQPQTRQRLDLPTPPRAGNPPPKRERVKKRADGVEEI